MVEQSLAACLKILQWRDMTYNHLEIEKRGTVSIVYLNRPEKLNTISQDVHSELFALSEALHQDSETRVVIFTGKGKNFSAGSDLSDPAMAEQINATRLQKLRFMRSGPRTIRSIYEINQITIAALNGYALGGGACIATACDFRIGAENCRVGYPEVGLAMNLSWVALPLCVHLIGPARAKEMVILARKEGAETLLKWGFLDEVVPEDQLLDKAMALADLYAAQPPMAAQMVKRSVNAISSALDQSVMHMDSDQYLYATSSDDFKEAVGAFFEKRDAVFKGD